MRLPHTDFATKVTLDSLVKKKVKYENADQNYRMTLYFLFFILAAFLINSYWLINSRILRVDELYLLLTKDILNFWLIILFTLAFCWLVAMKKKSGKLETEFEELRSEVIDKSSDFWQDTSWDNRHIVFNMIEEKYQINLFFDKD